MPPSPIKVLIVDDHQLVVDGMTSLLKDAKGFEVVGEANDGKKALELITAVTPHVVLMDIDMPVMNGIETTKAILKENPETKVLALTMYSEKGMIRKMMKQGAKGYLLKNAYQEELIGAIKKVNAGREYFSGDALMSLQDQNTTQLHGSSSGDAGINADLTEREIEILKLVAEGLSNNQIGEKLYISPRTVDTHRTNLMRKLEVHNIAGLIRYAIKNGFVE